MGVWTRQFSGRMSGEEFQFRSWIMNIPRSLVYFLPWLPLAFLRFDEPRPIWRRNRALLAGIAIPFALVDLMPGALPRFVMPSLGPAAWWFGELLSQENLHWPRWLGGKNFSAHLRNRIFIIVTAVVCLGMLAYATLIVPRLYHREKIKTHARQINAVVPASVPLYAVDPDYQPFLFYIRSRLIYVSRVDDLPLGARYLLVQPEKEQPVIESERWAPLHARPVLTVTDYRKRRVILLQVSEGNP